MGLEEEENRVRNDGLGNVKYTDGKPRRKSGEVQRRKGGRVTPETQSVFKTEDTDFEND